MADPRRTETPRAGLPLGWALGVLLVHLLVMAWPLPAPSAPTAPPTVALQTRQVVLAPPEATAPPQVHPPPRPARPRPASPPLGAPVQAPPQALPSAAVAPEPVQPEPDPLPEPAPEPPLAQATPEPPPTPPAPAAPEAAPQPPPELPAATRLSYRVEAYRNGSRYDATAVLWWQPEADRYTLRLEMRAFFLSREQSSTGRLGADGLRPERFAERTRSERAAHFDEASARVRFSANTPDAPWRPGTQDRLSLLVQLAGHFNAHPDARRPGTALSWPVVGARDLQEWRLTVEGEETLDLPQGPTPTLRLLRLPRREFDQKVEIWLAPSLGHLPARIRITEANGDVADQVLSGR